MFEIFNVFCSVCGWEGKREREDLNFPCPICKDGGNIITRIGSSVSDNNYELPVSLQETEQGNLDIRLTKESIERMGKEAIWSYINLLTGEMRLSYIEDYLGIIMEMEGF